MDLTTAKQILDDSTPARRHLDLLLTTPGKRGEELLLAFRVTRDSHHGVTTEEMSIAVIPDDDATVIQRLGRPLPPTQSLLEPVVATQPTGSPESTARIRKDIAELRTHLGADCELRLTSRGLFAAHVRRGANEVAVFFPPEYPLGAPMVFSGRVDTGPLQPVPLYYGWSSQHRLLDLVSEGLGSMTSPWRWPFWNRSKRHTLGTGEQKP